MNYSSTKPYLIIPKLIEQPTWGGEYILNLKNWKQLPFAANKKIGQSYELFGKSKLALKITNSFDPAFIPEVGSADSDAIDEENFTYKKNTDYANLSDLIASNPKEILGKTHTMPLLIKMNQASGNSFQLHVKPGTKDTRWQPKPESWYYLEDGAVTYGVNKNTNIEEYKKACHAINDKMKLLSKKVLNGEMKFEDAKKEAKEFIAETNPWQYVNKHRIKKYDLIDLSGGAVHHSWEEDSTLPYGNVLYEIQLDVMDPVSTIRSFDQGKFKSDGSIRELQIEDYFKYIDTDKEHNDIQTVTRHQEGRRLLKTAYYSMDILDVADKLTDHVGDTFCHLHVRDGEVVVKTSGGTVHLTRGHSCLLPHNVEQYEIMSVNGKATLLKSYIE